VTSHPKQLSDYYASAALHWPTSVANLEDKLAAADRIAARVANGQLVGIGSGSATYLALWAIGERVKREALSITVVTASYETEVAALKLGLRPLPLGSAQPDWGVDGADEVDPQGRILKGRGGAMFREKILWATCERMCLAIDPSKHVQRLGERFPVPVEVDRLAVDLVGRALERTGVRSWELRIALGKDGPVITENGNLVIDASYDEVPSGLSLELKSLPGVIETGLFEGYTYEIV
jgi:ribose 5-phosphate isomerase A